MQKKRADSLGALLIFANTYSSLELVYQDSHHDSIFIGFVLVTGALAFRGALDSWIDRSAASTISIWPAAPPMVLSI
jgi:hypothetical protein